MFLIPEEYSANVAVTVAALNVNVKVSVASATNVADKISVVF